MRSKVEFVSQVNRLWKTSVVVIALIATTVSCGSNETSQTRNATLVAGTPCKKPGQVTKVSKQSVVCAALSPKNIWYPVFQEKKWICAKLGGSRKQYGIFSVCGKNKSSKKRWFLTMPLTSNSNAGLPTTDQDAFIKLTTNPELIIETSPTTPIAPAASPSQPVDADNEVLAATKNPETTPATTTPAVTVPFKPVSIVNWATTGSGPRGMAIDNAGNIYTTNRVGMYCPKNTPKGTCTLSGADNVSIITPDGISTILGSTDSQPQGIAIDNAGNIYTANNDGENVSKITPKGESTILGPNVLRPHGIAIDNFGNIYTTNPSSDNVTKITPKGESTILGPTDSQPYGIAIDNAGNIYTANIGANNVTKITPDGTSTILGPTDSQPYGIAIDKAGNIYTANIGANNVSKITPDGTSTILGPTDSQPYGIAIDKAGNIYTTNSGANNVSKITPNGTSTILGSTGVGPEGIVIDKAGNIYTANSRANTVTKITTR